MSRKNDGLGFFGRKKKAFDEYVLIRKTRMKTERDYFASEEGCDWLYYLFDFLCSFKNSPGSLVEREGVCEETFCMENRAHARSFYHLGDDADKYIGWSIWCRVSQ